MIVSPLPCLYRRSFQRHHTLFYSHLLIHRRCIHRGVVRSEYDDSNMVGNTTNTTISTTTVADYERAMME